MSRLAAAAGIGASMASIYVARSVRAGKWASDVGLGKHIYKVGVTDEEVKLLVAAGWAGETDWQLVKTAPSELAEEEALTRPRRRPRRHLFVGSSR